MELAASSSDTASSPETASSPDTASSSSFSVIAPLSSSSSNAFPAPKMAEPSNANAEDLKMWTETLEKQFIDILLEAAAKQTTPNGKGKTKKDYWPSVTDEFNNRTGNCYSLSQITDKFKWLKKRHNVFSRLIRSPGMEWDPVTNTVTGSDAAWSEAMTLINRCSEFRKKGLDHYELLGQLFLAQTSSAQPISAEASNPKGKQPAHSATSIGLKRKVGSLDRSIEFLQVLGPFSMARVTEILESMDLDDETFFELLDILEEEPEKRQTFLSMNLKRRRCWIKRMTSLPKGSW